MTRQLLKLTTLTALTLALASCSGSSDDSSTTDPGNTPARSLATCIETDNDKGFANATDITNKTLHKLQSDTVVNVWDLRDGSKRGCTQSGSVEIL